MKIKIENINKTFFSPKNGPVTVLDNINLTVEEGGFVMILGESGCGKSTLLNILAGLLPPTQGEIRVDNKKVVEPHPSISMLFQEPSLLPWLSVEENVAFGCKLRGEKNNLKYRVSQYIELAGLSGSEKLHPRELSLGMAYRVCLARALIGLPEIFLLDEPFGALDTFTRTRLQNELINIWQSERFTAVFVTHDIDEAIIMGKNIVLLGGRPCSIHNNLDINLDHPRDMADESFINTKIKIIRELKKTIDEKNFSKGE